MINVRIQSPEVQTLSPKISVIGVGGAGGNAVDNMILSGLEGCTFLVANTDAQALGRSHCDNKIQLGVHVTGGLGAGARAEIGAQAAEETLDDVMRHLEGANMAFVTAGMGGGTGTGAAPIIAKACRESGVLTVGVVTKPFHFEGSHRMEIAEAGIREMQSYVDTLIVIPNQNLFRVANEKTTFAEAFKTADTVLQSGVRGVTDLMVMPGLINLDFADIRSAMQEMGKAMMGNGEAEGERRAVEAAESAINNPLLDDVSMKGARGVIINVTGGSDMTLYEVDEACNRVRDEVDPNANIIFGSTFDEALEGRMRVSIFATGIDVAEAQKTRPAGVRVTSVGKKPEQGQIQAQAQAQSQSQPQPHIQAYGQPQGQHRGQMTPLERAQPRAPSSLPETGSAGPSLSPAQPQMRPRSVSAPSPVSAPLAALRQAQAEIVARAAEGSMAQPPVDEPETDMFEQQEFSAASREVSSGAAPLRGQVQGSAFIPPRPAMPEAEPLSASGYGPSRLAASAPPATARPVAASEMPVRAPGLSLQPPVPGRAAAEAPRKPRSLFDRITDMIRDDRGSSEDGAVDPRAQQMRGRGVAPQAGQPGQSSQPQQQSIISHGRSGGGVPAKAAQGQLNIDSPSAKRPQADDELDIPAFLRRQAN